MHGTARQRLRFTHSWLFGALMTLFSAHETVAREEESEVELGPSEMCELIETHAERRNLPPAFFARLIWQESRFNRLAVSPKGAQGIAQFMPATAAERGLENPFDVPTSIAESAAFLQELTSTFGNLGLAAAGYNAGPQRVRRWLSGKARLPQETRHFVRTITGASAEEWQAPEIEMAVFTLDKERSFAEACERLVNTRLLQAPGDGIRKTSPVLPWGVQVAAHFSRAVAMSTFERLRREFNSVLGEREPLVVNYRAPARGNSRLHAVRIGAETRKEAEALCKELRGADGACMVTRN